MWSYIDYIVTFLFSFISRSIIVYYLGSEYLGLTSLFTSILQVLNVAESGFAVAITYNMYKPLAENDVDCVCSLLAFYRRIYTIIGVIVLVAGLIVMPFVPYLIDGDYPQNINIYFLYFLYLSNTSVSYFLFSYKTSLLNALQRLDLTKLAYCIVSVLQSIFQVLAIAIFKNFYLFVVVIIFGTAAKNIFTAYVSKKKFPQFSCKGELKPEIKKNISWKVRGLMICNISAITYTTFDSIIISKLSGLDLVAVYNNYLVIFNGVSNIIVLIRMAMQASVGNSVASESKEKNYNDLKKWQFMFSMIAMFCSSCLLCLYQPFMKIWMGEKMLLPNIDVVLFSVLFYVTTIQHAYYLYLNAAGLWLELRWAYISSAVLNILMNIILGHFFSTTGIIIATLTASVISGLIWQSIIIFKQYFRISPARFFLKQAFFFAIAVVSGVISYLISNVFGQSGIIILVLRFAICICISLMIVLVFFSRTEVYRSCLDIAKTMFKRN